MALFNWPWTWHCSCFTVCLSFLLPTPQISTEWAPSNNTRPLSHSSACQESGRGRAGSSTEGLLRLKSRCWKGLGSCLRLGVLLVVLMVVSRIPFLAAIKLLGAASSRSMGECLSDTNSFVHFVHLIRSGPPRVISPLIHLKSTD